MARLAEQEQVAPFNTVWSYNNAGFGLAGYIIEQVSGQSFESLLQEWVLAPLGLRLTLPQSYRHHDPPLCGRP